jgi:hypothetical protein
LHKTPGFGLQNSTAAASATSASFSGAEYDASYQLSAELILLINIGAWLPFREATRQNSRAAAN